MWNKIKYITTHGFYHPYFPYWFDLLTERKLKYRTGKCVDCVECCKYNCHCCKSKSFDCYCSFVDLKNKRCKIYDHRDCNVWFPISQKELDCWKKWRMDFKCKFKFEK